MVLWRKISELEQNFQTLLSFCPTSVDFPSVFTPSGTTFSRWRPIEQGIQDWSYVIEDGEGNEVYESQSPDQQGWNGLLSNGIEAPAGTYRFSFYGLFKTGRTTVESGSFVLVR
jgi:flagellar hook assembly protein FlgD